MYLCRDSVTNNDGKLNENLHFKKSISCLGMWDTVAGNDYQRYIGRRNRRIVYSVLQKGQYDCALYCGLRTSSKLKAVKDNCRQLLQSSQEIREDPNHRYAMRAEAMSAAIRFKFSFISWEPFVR